jgi:uncharacterized protein YdeI (YjbR/CyaY-like superfamily)
VGRLQPFRPAGVLTWIVQAKRPETRANRIGETVRLAALGEVANTCKPKT